MSGMKRESGRSGSGGGAGRPSNREVRRCALQALYQFDVVESADHELVRASLAESPGSEADHAGGFDLATMAWEFRDEADAIFAPMSPEWPAHRQPPIDRNLLRLAYYEMVVAAVPPRVVMNESVELAKEFGGERSPAFINAMLDRMWKARSASEAGSNADADAGLDTGSDGVR